MITSPFFPPSSLSLALSSTKNDSSFLWSLLPKAVSFPTSNRWGRSSRPCRGVRDSTLHCRLPMEWCIWPARRCVARQPFSLLGNYSLHVHQTVVLYISKGDHGLYLCRIELHLWSILCCVVRAIHDTTKLYVSFLQFILYVPVPIFALCFRVVSKLDVANSTV